MKMNDVTKNVVTPSRFIKFKITQAKHYKLLILSSFIFALSGCITTHNQPPTAKAPPVEPTPLSQKTSLQHNTYDASVHVPTHMVSQNRTPILQDISPTVAFKRPQKTSTAHRCGIKDRFDRKALLAYEWNRSRFSVDTEGLGLGGMDGFRLEYKIRLQPEKPTKRKCRTPSQWQGIIGTGYHEFVTRENDTVFDEMRVLNKQIANHIERNL